MDKLLIQFKLMVRNRTGLFWTMIFPFVLGTLFLLAFGKILSDEIYVLDPIPVALVEEGDSSEYDTFKDFLGEIGSESKIVNQEVKVLEEKEDPIFHYIPTNMDQAETYMEENLIYGVILKGEDSEFILSPSSQESFKLNIIESLLNNFEQSYSAISTIMEEKMKAGEMDPSFPEKAREILLVDHKDLLKDISPKELSSPYIIIFFTLMGYAAMLTINNGTSLVANQLEADITTTAMRQELSPSSKISRFLLGAFPRLVFQMLVIGLLFLYLNLSGVSFGDQTGFILLITEVGVLTGFFIGTALATTFRKSKSILMGLGTSISLLLAALAGLMNPQIKYYVGKHAPWIQKINPVNRITDGIYSLFYYEGYDRYLENLVALLMITGVLILITLVNLRRNQYESL